MNIVYLFCLVPLVVAVNKPVITVLVPKGVKFEINDEGFSLVAVHFSINQPLKDTAAGQFNFDITTKTGNLWVYNNKLIKLKAGDIIHYWIWANRNGVGEHLLNQQHVVQTGGKQNACMVFEDTFDTLNHEIWQHDISAGGGGNWEFQYYTNNRSNSYVRNGVLYIKPTLTADKYGEWFIQNGILDLWGNGPVDTCTGNAYYGCKRTGSLSHPVNPVQSALLRSSRGFNFRYGKVEVKAKMPLGDWIWPAIWMLPSRNAYGEWPASGEIDIVESRGNRNFRDHAGNSVGADSFGSTLHFGPHFPHDAYQTAHITKSLTSGTLGDDWHTYGLEWTEDHIKYFFDGEEIKNISPPSNGGFWAHGGFNNLNVDNPWENASKMAPFDQKFYIILNVAVGGGNGYFPDNAVNSPHSKPWTEGSEQTTKQFWEKKNEWYPTWNPNIRNGEDAALKIDYVRVWKLKATECV